MSQSLVEYLLSRVTDSAELVLILANDTLLIYESSKMFACEL